jgi:hypothetical protein
LDKGKDVPYDTAMTLSLFLGQPLESSLSGPAILAHQPPPNMPNNAPSQQPKAKKSTNALAKSFQRMQSPTQARENDRLSG